jgi:type VI secretion system secreted protein Hcp
VAVDTFLKLGDIEGESTDDAHKDEIDVLAFSWGLSQPTADLGSGHGTGAGKAVFEDLVVVKRVDKASPKLFEACATGTHVQAAALTCRKAGKAKQEFFKIRLSDVLVTSYEVDSSEEDRPLDQIALSFAKVELEYVPVDATGKALAPVKAAFDLTKRAKV